MFEVYSTKPGDSAKVWKWALTLEGSGLTRKQAARLAETIRQREGGHHVKVYCLGTYCYTLA